MTRIERTFVDTRQMDARIGSQMIMGWVDMKYRVNIDELSDDKQELMKKIENAIFKTKAHIQRSIGITRIPEKNIKNIEMIDIKECEKYEKIVEKTKEIFTNKYPELFKN